MPVIASSLIVCIVGGASGHQGPEWLAMLPPCFVAFLLTQASGITMLRSRGKSAGETTPLTENTEKTSLLMPCPVQIKPLEQFRRLEMMAGTP